MNRQKFLIIVLGIGLIAVVQYLIIDKLNELKEQEMMKIFQQAYDLGASDLMDLLYEKTQNCQVAQISIGNDTKNLLDYACLNSEKIP